MEENNILDSREEIAKIDLDNVLGSVEALPEQCKDAFSQASEVMVPEEYKNIDNLVMCGMGGSGLAARIIESVYTNQLKIPLVRVNDYDIPAFVNENTLVICSSYSGTTEETIENVNQSIVKKAKWMAIGTGNKLLELADNMKVPYYRINPTNNPSDQPRMAIGYSLIGQLVIVSKAGLIKLVSSHIDDVVVAMNKVKEACKPEIPSDKNLAKKLALNLKGKVVMFVASSHLTGAIHTVNNQLNENAKNISFDATIPELNHHLMEGLKHPEVNSNNIFVIFANSNLYSERIKKRFEVTNDVVSKNNIDSYEYLLTEGSPLSQVFELIQFGAYVNFYLSILYGQNPSPIPWVDYFKTQMGQPLGK